MATDVQTQAAPQIAQVVRRLRQEAQGHMRLSSQHRQRARTLHAEADRFEEFIRECTQRGVEVVIDGTDFFASTHPAPMPEGGTSGDTDTQAVDK